MKIQRITYGPKRFVGLKKVFTFDEVKEARTYDEGYAKIMTYLSEHKIQPSGAPVNIYFTWDEAAQKTTMAIAFPVDWVESVQDSELELIEIPESKAIRAAHHGDYMRLKETHEAMMDYLKQNDLEFDKYGIEEYLSDPKTEPDQSKWITGVYYTIK